MSPMSDRRVVIETPCEHGLSYWHPVSGTAGCYGHIRRVLEPGSYVLIEKDDAATVLREYLTDGRCGMIWLEDIPDLIDRLAGDTP